MLLPQKVTAFFSSPKVGFYFTDKFTEHRNTMPPSLFGSTIGGWLRSDKEIPVHRHYKDVRQENKHRTQHFLFSRNAISLDDMHHVECDQSTYPEDSKKFPSYQND